MFEELETEEVVLELGSGNPGVGGQLEVMLGGPGADNFLGLMCEALLAHLAH